MVQTAYSDQNLFGLAKENYYKLIEYCEMLETEGYWEQPEAILHKSILEMLDLYIQSVLINLSIYCGKFDKAHKQFIIELPNTNAIACSLEEETEEVLRVAKKMVSSPPIIIQLCGMRDVEKDSGILGKFFDSLLNILLSISCLSTERDVYLEKFIQEYYNKISAFLINTRKNKVDSKYLFRKLSSGKIEYHPFEEEERKEKERIQREQEYKAKIQEEQERIKEQEDRAKVQEEQGRIKEYGIEQTEKVTKIQIDEFNKEQTEFFEKQREQEDIQILNKQERNKKQDKINEEKVVIEEHIKKQNEDFYSAACDTTNVETIKLDWSTLKASQQEKLELAKQELEKINLIRLQKEIAEKNKEERLNQLLEELNQLIGLESVKSEIKSLINVIKVRKMRENFNMPELEMTYHMVFTGNPGTGKTTVARLVAKIYKELGLLSKGNFVETDRSGLVAGFVGQTAIKVKEVIEKSLGGVLFIDEAYSLTNHGITNDFGGEAVDTLVKMMEDHRDDLVIIVAGYHQEMQNFLKSNTGLVSRFNKFIDFPDYTLEELMQILDSMAEKSGVTLEEEAKKKIEEKIRNLLEEKRNAFGNARGIRNIFEKIMVNQANRIVNCKEMSLEHLSSITIDDVIDIL